MLIEEVRECSKCGKCRSVCPVFGVVNDEVMSPRGRISLIEALLEGNLSNSERYTDTIMTCIRCARCSNTCPVGIRMEDITQMARELLAEKVGIPDAAREVFRDLLPDPEAFRSALVEAASSPSESEVPLLQLPLFFLEGTRLPKLAEETTLDKYPEYIDSGGTKRVALFVGCAMNYVNTDIADSAIEVLGKLGVDIFLPKDQVCCGEPVLLFGDREGFNQLAERNINALKADEFDAVVTLCPGCGVMLKRECDLESEVYDISEFIHKELDYETQPADVTVTYHEPCYLRLGQDVSDEPRQILGKSARLVEMKDADKCCGLGGALGAFHPELSVQMAQDKIKAIEESGADVVATGCAGCILFLREQLDKSGIQKDVLHTIQVLQKGL